MKRIAVLLLLFLSSAVFAQTARIQGTVKDEKGRPIEGATVYLSGSFNGTTTDSKGFYSISIPLPASDCVLEFSGSGYLPASERVGSRNTINVSLKIDNRIPLTRLEEYLLQYEFYDGVTVERIEGSADVLEYMKQFMEEELDEESEFICKLTDHLLVMFIDESSFDEDDADEFIDGLNDNLADFYCIADDERYVSYVRTDGTVIRELIIMGSDEEEGGLTVLDFVGTFPLDS